MRSPKLRITRDMFPSPADQTFLMQIEELEPEKLTDGKWNKLYAMLAQKRKDGGPNYCIYQGQYWEYDTTNRDVIPINREGLCSIGEILKGKK